jgi:4-amino-4-deoxy-L-arabinose transferase-like glycosyltransferase
MRSLEQYLGRQRAYRLLVLAVLGLGFFVRVWHFPSVPPGLNQDEAASAYEAYSLAETGCDKWGNPWPAYFPAWGSGQNVLLAYLTVPVVKAFGLSIFSARLVSLLVGLLTLPLFYYGLRPMGRYPALLGLLLLALAPWHFMLSRWGLESNLAPFWMLLGCVMVAQAVSTQQRRWIIPSLLPFAIALYAYGITLIILPTLFVLVLIAFFQRVNQRPGPWLLAACLFVVVAAPFGLFIIENYVLGHNLPWTDKLFFSTPVLPATRLSQESHNTLRDIYEVNSMFVARGFTDSTIYNQLPGYPLLLRFTWALAALGSCTLLYRLAKWRTQLSKRQHEAMGLLLLAWAVACIPLIFLFGLNTNRVNHFFLPCLGLAAWFVNMLIRHLRPSTPKQFIRGAVLAWFVLEGGLAASYYLRHYPQGPIKKQFNSGLPAALAAVNRLQGVGQVYITPHLPLGYVYTLFYQRYPPARFQREAQVGIDSLEGAYQVNRFGRYIFNNQYLAQEAAYGYLLYKDELQAADQTRRKVLFSNETWEVGIMLPLQNSLEAKAP